MRVRWPHHRRESVPNEISNTPLSEVSRRGALRMFGAFFVTTNWYPAICQPATTEPSSASRERSRQWTSHAWFLRQDGDDLAELQLFVHRLRCIIRDTLVSGSAAADLMLWKISVHGGQKLLQSVRFSLYSAQAIAAAITASACPLPEACCFIFFG